MRLKSFLGTVIFLLTLILGSTVTAKEPVIVLCYHDIPNPDEISSYMDVPPDKFKDQMDFLKRNNYNVIPLTEIVQWIKEGGKLPDRTVGISFDDNYLGTYTNAFPILIRYKFPATTFIHTKYPGVATLKDHADWKELQESEDSGYITVESHTVTHSMLTTLSREEAKKEIEGSKKDIESHLRNKVCRYLAYPCNSYDDEIIKMAQDAGYEAAICGKEGSVNQSTPHYEIRRKHLLRYNSLDYFKEILEYEGNDPKGPIFIEIESKNVKTKGKWISSEEGFQFYSSRYLKTASHPNGKASVTYKPVIPQSGNYHIYAWYNSQGPRNSEVNYSIHHAQGTETVKINQQSQGARWVSLGTYPLNVGKTNWVSISNQGPEGAWIIADALKFEPAF